MPAWQTTHSLNCRGSYLRIGVHELYVREKVGQVGAVWFLDGQPGSQAGNALSAQAAAEEACRRMDRTHTARMAASA